MTSSSSLLWFRQDLRLADHAALIAAAKAGPVIPLYILDDETPGTWRMGGASRWWLHRSLLALSADLAKLGSKLILRRGRPDAVVPALLAETGAGAVHATRLYEPWALSGDAGLAKILAAKGGSLRLHDGGFLFPPGALATKTGGPFKVYSPFARAAFASAPPPRPVTAPKSLPVPVSWPKSERLDDWHLLPTKPNWAKTFDPEWTPGEVGAKRRLKRFLDHAMARYAEDRDIPAIEGTSRLSPHLHFGEISAATCWWAAATAAEACKGRSGGAEKFQKELLWREFSNHLLVQAPDLPAVPFRPEFNAFPWQGDAQALQAWQKGQTGYPIVDAGMRELWATGYMHNRVRMIVASFLVKHLLVPWQQGEAWFWDTLVDADLANNAASWQWVAGCGADAAPYFRIFNPMLQGVKFDPEGLYVRRWVPELAGLRGGGIHAPFDLSPMEQLAGGVRLGTTYPHPIVDHATARARALAAFEAIKTAAH